MSAPLPGCLPDAIDSHAHHGSRTSRQFDIVNHFTHLARLPRVVARVVVQLRVDGKQLSQTCLLWSAQVVEARSCVELVAHGKGNAPLNEI